MTRETYEWRKRTYTRYLEDRIQDEDFHGVQDACADLRELAREYSIASNPPTNAVLALQGCNVTRNVELDKLRREIRQERWEAAGETANDIRTLECHIRCLEALINGK